MRSIKYRSLNETTKLTINAVIALAIATLLASSALAQTAPPTLGQETKGTPAVTEGEPLPETEQTPDTQSSEQTNTENESDGILGTATITELRRENGQIYEIELDHSLGGKQYIQENDSDGNIESTSNDLEETPNLPKWKLGSW